jgi:hypothetical protein
MSTTWAGVRFFRRQKILLEQIQRFHVQGGRQFAHRIKARVVGSVLKPVEVSPGHTGRGSELGLRQSLRNAKPSQISGERSSQICGACGGSLSLLRSAVWTHDARLSAEVAMGQLPIESPAVQRQRGFAHANYSGIIQVEIGAPLSPLFLETIPKRRRAAKHRSAVSISSQANGAARLDQLPSLLPTLVARRRFLRDSGISNSPMAFAIASATLAASTVPSYSSFARTISIRQSAIA